MQRSAIIPVLLMMVFLGSCGTGQGPQKAQSVDTGNEGEGAAFIEFSNIRHDFGNVRHGERLVYTFRYKNTGNAPLVIHSASADCGCTVPEFDSSPLGPGEEGSFRVVFDTRGFRGRQVKTINLFTNAENGIVTLALRAMIE